MVAFVAVLIDLSCEYSLKEIVFICNMRHPQLWMLSRHKIFCVKDIFPSGIMLLEMKDGQECREYSKNCALYHIFIERTLHPKLAMMFEGLLCFARDEKKGATTMLLCNICQRGWHMTCLTSPLTSLPSCN